MIEINNIQFQWTEDLSTGSYVIDRQHKEIFRRVNLLLDSFRTKSTNEEVKNLIEFLSGYVQYHFSVEEKYMKEYNYYKYMEHKSQHDDFRSKVNVLLKEFLDGKDITEKLKISVIDWLINHISKVDKVLGYFLRGKIDTVFKVPQKQGD